MKRNIIQYSMLTIIIALIISGCTQTTDKGLEEELTAKNEIIGHLEQEKKELEDRIIELEEKLGNQNGQNDSLIKTAFDVVQLLKNKDIKALSEYVHPDNGLRFSPYGYIEEDNNQLFSSTQINNLLNDTNIYTWGSYDGTGDPIDLTFGDYYNKFVYDQDFANPHIIGNNIMIGKGNTVNNISDVYPNGEFIEFHFTGSNPQFEGMDWKSLRLVFENDNGSWYLIGIIHDQWTI